MRIFTEGLPAEPSKWATLFQSPEWRGWGMFAIEKWVDPSMGPDSARQKHILLSLILSRHLEGEPDLPVCPYKANLWTLRQNHTQLPNSYKSVAWFFKWGRGTPTHTLVCCNWLLFSTFCGFLRSYWLPFLVYLHFTCYVHLNFLHVWCAEGCQWVIMFM